MELGVCTSTGKIIEGRVSSGRELSPAPMVSPCKFVKDKSECTQGPITSIPTEGYIFREDYFDPKSRIRRGRIYAAYNSQPHSWKASNTYGVTGRFNTYGDYSIWQQVYQPTKSHIYVLLGDEKRFTTWKLVDIEVLATGEELITLKALTTFGLLPELLHTEIPENQLPLIQKKLAMVVDDMYTASSESIVDCCREAASAVLGAYLEKPNKDLGTLKNLLAECTPPKNLAKDLANTIGLLHSRRKSSEERGKGLRSVTDEDAHLAVMALATILIEIGWGRW
ncbi:MAG: hypothetical protein CMK46_00725 [Porticoccus sp.]|nr:hypothetical protein [Porticoccus sp.]|tara:strand:+ start:10997 stop:11839 length:843 start_codon:yes stop_codon:yes gene_type:complete